MSDVMARVFNPVSLGEGLLIDISKGEYPTKVFGFNNSLLELPRDATHYGMVTEGRITVDHEGGGFEAKAGMFFVVPGRATVDALDHGPEHGVVKRPGRGLIISRLGYRGLFQLGGPIEAEGRLRYIDGCSDTLLVCPPVVGEPCLNHLHLPAGTSQTAHTHPTERIGVILQGSGECRTPDGVFPLAPGMGWRIPPETVHSFFTFGQSLDVIAWHPDSDFGPKHDDHPMINRTYVDDVSARYIDEIRTK